MVCFVSLTLTKSDVGVGHAGGSDYVTYFLFGLGVPQAVRANLRAVPPSRSLFS